MRKCFSLLHKSFFFLFPPFLGKLRNGEIPLRFISLIKMGVLSRPTEFREPELRKRKLNFLDGLD